MISVLVYICTYAPRQGANMHISLFSCMKMHLCKRDMLTYIYVHVNWLLMNKACLSGLLYQQKHLLYGCLRSLEFQ